MPHWVEAKTAETHLCIGMTYKLAQLFLICIGPPTFWGRLPGGDQGAHMKQLC